MSSTKRNTDKSKADPAPRPARNKWVRLLLLLAILFGGGLATGYTMGLRHSPLGSIIPPRPQPLFDTKNVEIKDSSAISNRFSVKIVDRLAPQPDGASPLDGRIPSERGAYSMVYPFGAQLVNLTPEIFAKEGLDAQVNFKYEQPVFLLNMSLLRREQAQSYWDIALEQISAQEQAGAQLAGKSDFTSASGNQFACFEYTIKGPEGDQEYRQVFVAPYGGYCLVLDFMAKARHASQARALARKIVATFDSEWSTDKRLIDADRQRPQ